MDPKILFNKEALLNKHEEKIKDYISDMLKKLKIQKKSKEYPYRKISEIIKDYALTSLKYGLNIKSEIQDEGSDAYYYSLTAIARNTITAMPSMSPNHYHNDIETHIMFFESFDKKLSSSDYLEKFLPYEKEFLWNIAFQMEDAETQKTGHIFYGFDFMAQRFIGSVDPDSFKPRNTYKEIQANNILLENYNPEWLEENLRNINPLGNYDGYYRFKRQSKKTIDVKMLNKEALFSLQIYKEEEEIKYKNGSIKILGMKVPETLLESMSGKALRKIINMPIIGGADLKIKKARQTDMGVKVKMTRLILDIDIPENIRIISRPA